MAGFMIENLETGKVKQFHYEDIDHLPENITRLDVRTPAEYAGGCADGFVNIPVDELRGRLSEIDPGKPVYVMCQSALRSYIACRILAQHGYDCYNFSGGYRFYEANRKDRFREDVNTPCGAAGVDKWEATSPARLWPTCMCSRTFACAWSSTTAKRASSTPSHISKAHGSGC